MASTILTRTNTSTGNNKILTWSGWVKRSDSSTGQLIMANGDPGSSNYIIFFEFAGSALRFIIKSLSILANVETNAVFRDTSAWYHLVFNMDTTQATASDRVKMYVNGEQITSFATASYPSQNLGTQFNNADSVTSVGGKAVTGANTDFFNGYMSHVHCIDGTIYGPSTFGEVDSTTGQWKIKTSPSVTYGTNGFFILKDGNSVTDQSGNGNNLTVGGGTLTNTEDSPSNVFATMNPLDNYYAGATFEHGNTEVITTQSAYTYCTSTLKMGSGKYYIEGKWTGTGGGNSGVGIVNTSSTATSNEMTAKANGSVITDSGLVYANGSSTGTNLGSFSVNDIVMIAFDGGNNAIYYGKNGTWLNSGDPTSGASKTGAFTPSSTTGLDYFIGFGDQNSSFSYRIEFNFGNGFFATTAVASAGTNASGNGIFEYDVPTGYTALSTKGLNL